MPYVPFEANGPNDKTNTNTTAEANLTNCNILSKILFGFEITDSIYIPTNGATYRNKCLRFNIKAKISAAVNMFPFDSSDRNRREIPMIKPLY